MYTQNLSITRNYMNRNYGPVRRIKQRVCVVTRLLVEKFTTVGPFAVTTRTCRRLSLKCDDTRAETRFRLSAKRMSPFKSAGGVSSVDYWQLRCAHQR